MKIKRATASRMGAVALLLHGVDDSQGFMVEKKPEVRYSKGTLSKEFKYSLLCYSEFKSLKALLMCAIIWGS
ncbi:MAG: hypothetical protein OEV93_03435 [Candidatus Moranbacteria bacterium]|nr:hypothetical protein [Candidatus Moranbacteria bacterium]